MGKMPAALLLLLCAAAVAHAEQAPVSLERPGEIARLELRLWRCNAVQTGLSFHTRELSRDEEQRLLGDGSFDTRTRTYGAPGVAVPLAIRVLKLPSWPGSKAAAQEVRAWRQVTQGVSSFRPVEDRLITRDAGMLTLPAGRYQVVATLDRAVPEVAGIPAVFWAGTNFKYGPAPGACR